jgi:hypothetical protein
MYKPQFSTEEIKEKHTLPNWRNYFKFLLGYIIFLILLSLFELTVTLQLKAYL